MPGGLRRTDAMRAASGRDADGATPHKPGQTRTGARAPRYDGARRTKGAKGWDVTRSDDEGKGSRESLDAIARDLRELREDAGVVSYAEIARRIAEHRQAAGADPETCRPARSTVYDVFRPGRSRVSTALVGEVARALGVDDDGVAQWIGRCRAANATAERRSAERGCPDEAVRSADTGRPSAPVARARMSRSWRFVVGVMAVGLVLNSAGHLLVGTLHLSLYLDMVGTALTALLLGPWCGAAVALAGTVAGTAVHGAMALPFALVNVVGALIWGYGVRSWRLGATMPRFFLLSLLAALACTLIATPVLVFVFGGGTGHAGDQVTRTFESFGEPLAMAVLQANLFTSIIDKLLTGFVALAAASGIREWARRRGAVPVAADLLVGCRARPPATAGQHLASRQTGAPALA